MILNQHIHFIGIGGAGLSAVAKVLHERGHVVSGSDLYESDITEKLQSLGVLVHIGHQATNISGADVVIASSAVPSTNPELVAAAARNIKVLRRQDVLGNLMKTKLGCAIAGSHGKTTTTALISFCLLENALKPTFIVGGTVNGIDTNARYDVGEPFVVEADEYDRMFLGLSPTVSVVTSIDYDHPDCYSTFGDLEDAFWEFAMLTPIEGRLVINQDDILARKLGEKAKESGIPVVTYALQNEADWKGENIRVNSNGGCSFSLVNTRKQYVKNVDTCLAGEHNVMNVLAAIAAVDFYDLSIEKIVTALREFRGVKRRFEIKGKRAGITIVDDYAHHPMAIKATLGAARLHFPNKKLWALFQPHTYSRTHALTSEIASSFYDADHVVITDIFASREKDDGTISSKNILELMDHPDAHYVGDINEAARFIFSGMNSGDVLVTMSAGDGYKVGERVLNMLCSRNYQSGDALDLLFAQLGEKLRKNESMASYTSARIGGPADYFVQARSVDELSDAVQTGWEAGIPVLVFGSGSNLLVSDKGVRGLVVHNLARSVVFEQDQSQMYVNVGSGTMLASLARMCIKRGAGGLEWAVSVPGTVGGAVVGNAGAHGSDISTNILLADILQRGKGTKSWTLPELGLSYRSSNLKISEDDLVMLRAEFVLEQVHTETLRSRASGFIQHRRETQPPGASIGSMFKNPPGDYAGRLIEKAGLKGFRLGKAEISTVHANFFVNLGGASATEVVGLINKARRTVRKFFDIDLELEIQLIGEWL
ncbi:MAG TPA: hypothetical protein DGN60_01630 [Chloroflexi bacterium]|nr:hypothetical protein [Chloroflexota bacterium]